MSPFVLVPKGTDKLVLSTHPTDRIPLCREWDRMYINNLEPIIFNSDEEAAPYEHGFFEREEVDYED